MDLESCRVELFVRNQEALNARLSLFKTWSLSCDYLDANLRDIWTAGGLGFLRGGEVPSGIVIGNPVVIRECKWREQVWIVERMDYLLQPHVSQAMGFGQCAVLDNWFDPVSNFIEEYEETCQLRVTQITPSKLQMQFARTGLFTGAEKKALRDSVDISLKYFTGVEAPGEVRDYRNSARGRGFVELMSFGSA